MTELVGFAFSEGGVIVSVAAGTLGVLLRPHSRLARRILAFVVVSYTLASVYAVSFALARPLVMGYGPLTAGDVPPGPTAVIVLGSGSYSLRDWSGREYSAPDAFAASRVMEAVRVYTIIHPVVVIASGGKESADQAAEATGVVMRDLLMQLGVPADRIVTELTSRNTREEAQRDLAVVRSLKAAHVVLVTSPFHMRRSIGTFRAEGVEVIPAIARDPFPAESWQDWVVPGDLGLWASASLAHEVLGIGYYAARGWYR